MALPVTKQELADWILRRLGAPVVNIEITDEQLEDVIDEAVQMFQEWHYDGAERTFRVVKIEGDVLDGNNRRHQSVNAPLFDITKIDSYRVGDRVMTYDQNGKPDLIWVKYDSEERVGYYTYEASVAGEYFQWNTAIADLYFIHDSEASFHTDSDGGYVVFDSDQHIGAVYTEDSEFGFWVDSDGNGNYEPYDSDSHAGMMRYDRSWMLLGTRYNRSYSRDIRQVLTFEEQFKREDKILAEPVINYDYSQEGQVGVIIPENIIGISKVFRIDNFSGMGMWNYEYQYFLNNFDFFYGNGGASQMPMTNYYITKSYLELIDHMMNVQPAIRFSKHRNRLYLDTNWKRLNNMSSSKDYYLMMECYEVNDPDVWGDVYKDKWLKRYAVALAKQQWGSNMKKYSNTQLPGGLMIDGQALYDEAREEIDALEDELKRSQLEMDFFIG